MIEGAARPTTGAVTATTTRPVSPHPCWSRRDTALILVLMAVAFLRASLYATIQAPWYAPDEVNHVEYALLMRAHGPLVGADQIDPALRLVLTRSLYTWQVIGAPPEGQAPVADGWLGQIGRQPPLYYILASWAAALVPVDDIVGQLYAMRLLSALLGTAIVGAAYLAGRLLCPASELVALGLAGVILFQSGLGALLGSVNNDNLATLAVTLTLVVSAALVRGPLPVGRLLWGSAVLGATVALALLAKRTALVAVPGALLALVLAFLPPLSHWLAARRLRWLLGALPLVGLLLILLAVATIDGRQAIGWELANAERVSTHDGPVSSQALRLGAAAQGASVTQIVAGAHHPRLEGRAVTVGVWLRQVGTAPAPPVVVRLEQKVGRQLIVAETTISATDRWQYVSLPATMLLTLGRVTVIVGQYAASPEPVVVGGLFLVIGERAGQPPPVLTGAQVRWPDATVENLLSNGDFSAAPLVLRPWVSSGVERLIGRPIQSLWSEEGRAHRPPDTAAEWQLTIWEPFFKSLWGRFGRLIELVMPVWWYTIHAGLLAAASVGGLVGLTRAAWRRQIRLVQLKVGALGGLVLIGALMTTLGPYILGLYGGTPFGRYFLVAILPLAGLYVAGLVWVWPARWRGWALVLLLTLLAVLDCYALFHELPNLFSLVPPLPAGD